MEEVNDNLADSAEALTIRMEVLQSENDQLKVMLGEIRESVYEAEKEDTLEPAIPIGSTLLFSKLMEFTQPLGHLAGLIGEKI